MGDLQEKLGNVIADALTRCLGSFPGHDEMRKILCGGDLDVGAGRVREILEKRGPVGGLAAAVMSAFPDAGEKAVREALTKGDYGTFVGQLTELARDGYVIGGGTDRVVNPFAQPTLDAAKLLCGSVVVYEARRGGPTKDAVISRISAWKEVGGADQTIPQAEPGTAGAWHSNKMGGYDVAIIAAHPRRQTGIVAIYAVRPLDNGRLEAEVNKKTQIANDFGFTNARVTGQNVLDTNTPLSVRMRDGKTDIVTLDGVEYEVAQEKDPKEGGSDIMLGSFKLSRAK